MTQPQSRAFQSGGSFAKFSRPQNILFSGLLSVIGATVSDSKLLRSLLCYLTIFSLYSLAAGYNNIKDKHIDTINKRTDNPFSTGAITKTQAYVFLWLHGLLLLCLQPFIAQPISIMLVSTYLLLLFGYSHERINLQSKGEVAHILLALCYATIPIYLGYAQNDVPLSNRQLLVGLLIGLLLFPALLTKDYKDEKGDRAGGKFTPLVRHGATYVRNESILILMVAAIIVIYYAGSMVDAVLISLFAAVYAGIVIHVHVRRGKTHRHILRIPQVTLLLIFVLLSS